MRRRKTWLLIGIVVVLAAFLVPWRAAADKIGVLVSGTYYSDIGTLLAGSGITGFTVADTTDTTTWPVLATDATGAVSPKTDGALTYNAGTGLLSATLFGGALNGTVGATTPAAGAFTTLAASSTVSGTGFSTYLASPPAIGGTAAAAGTFTTLTGNTASIGAGGFTVDTDGDVVMKSYLVTRTDSPDYIQVYEATSDGDNSARWMAPAKGSGFTSTNYYRFPVAAPSGAQVMSFPTPSDNSTQATWVTPLTTSLATNAVDAANSIWAVSNGLVFEGATANDYETTIQPADPTADRTITLPDASGTVQLTTKTVVDGSVALVLTSAQVSGTIISNTGQGVNDINHTLPAAAAGYTFRAMVGEAQDAKYWRFTRAGTDTVCLDGTCEKTYVSIAAPTRGATLDCATLQVALTGMKSSASLAIGSTKTNVYSAAFTYDAAGTGYAKAEVVAGTAPSAATTPQNKYGAQAFDIGADGTIDAVPCTNIATGFDSAALAIADLPAAAAGHARLGYVTAMNTDAGGFVWATTEFDVAGVTEAYTSAAVYTKPYAWVCNTLTGTWSTD